MKRKQRREILEAVGFLAIIVSLVFLAFEIRQNTIAVQREDQLTILVLAHEWDAWLRDAQFASTYAMGLNDYSSLSSVQLLQFDRYVDQGLNIWESSFYSNRAGVMTDETWNSWNNFFSSEIRQDSWQRRWASIGDAYGVDFQAYVDALIAKEL